MKKIKIIFAGILLMLNFKLASAMTTVCIQINGKTECVSGVDIGPCEADFFLEFMGETFPQGWTCTDARLSLKSRYAYLNSFADGRVFIIDDGANTKVASDIINNFFVNAFNKIKVKGIKPADFKKEIESLYRNDKGIVSPARLNAISKALNIPVKPAEQKSLRGTKFEEKNDFTWSNPLLMKTLGYESITFKRGVYQVTAEGAVTLNILATGKPLVTPSQNLIRVSASGTKQYRGMECFSFGFSCCVYDKVPGKDNEPVDYQFALKDGKAVTLTILFRGSGSPKSPGF